MMWNDVLGVSATSWLHKTVMNKLHGLDYKVLLLRKPRGTISFVWWPYHCVVCLKGGSEGVLKEVVLAARTCWIRLEEQVGPTASLEFVIICAPLASVHCQDGPAACLALRCAARETGVLPNASELFVLRFSKSGGRYARRRFHSGGFSKSPSETLPRTNKMI